MANVLNVKVDVRLLDKARFFEGKENKSGHRPLYADLVLIPRKEVGTYGDTHMVVQSKKKDENIQMPILGNATERGGNQSGSQSQSGTKPVPATAPKAAATESGDVAW